MAKAKSSKKGLLGFEGDTSFQAQSQTKAGIAVDFDMISMLALVYAINTLGPQKTVNSFLGFWGDAFGAIAAGLGDALGGGVDWVADGVGGGVDWLGDQLGL